MDFRDPPPAGNDSFAIGESCGFGAYNAHHCWVTAVHAMHLHTGKVLMFHGVADQRVWHIDGLTTTSPDGFEVPFAGTVNWTPLGFAGGSPTGTDLFCSGHAQLADGSMLIAGGNIDGSAGAGGLNSVFRYLPPTFSSGEADDPGVLECPYWWDLEPSSGATPWVNPHDAMEHDRWYPTLTTLRDGRVLIAGGYSRAQGAGENAVSSNLIEIYDPQTRQTTHLNADDGDGNTNNDEVRFFENEGAGAPTAVPTYPFIFQLPNGDVLYAGGESPFTLGSAGTQNGRILVAPENSANNRWEWANNTLPSEVTGGSAVMFAPGIVLKTGGRAIDQDDDGLLGPDDSSYQTARAQVIDLAGVPGGVDSYAGIAFQPTQPMAEPRHYHNMVVLPNGHVVTVGGARADNGVAGDRWENPCCTGGPPAPEFDSVPSKYACEQGGTPVIEQSCLDGCASSCETYYGQSPNTVCNLNVDGLSTEPETRCAYLEAIECCEGRSAAACDADLQCHFEGTCDGGAQDGLACSTNAACGEDFDCVGNCVDDIPGLDVSRCDDAMDGASCAGGRCEKACDPSNDPATECPPIQPVGTNDECLLVADELPTEPPQAGADDTGAADGTAGDPAFKGYCAPANNECFAAYTTEVWDPSCGAWTQAAEQTYPRLYHSTALLLPDGRVMSTGGGHRDSESQADGGGYKIMNDYPYLEYFEPDYAKGTGAAAPELRIRGEEGNPLGDDEEAYLPWYSDESFISFPGWAYVQTRGDVARFSIIRLGSTTHGFDQDQRFANLEAIEVADDGAWIGWLVQAPQRVLNPNGAGLLQSPDTVLPPGYYMLFAVSSAGVPSAGEYIRVGPDETVEGLCVGDPGVIAASTVECTGEPTGGACGTSDEVAVALSLPKTTDATGNEVAGWRVVLEPGAEPETLGSLCALACEQHFAAIPGATASCAATGAIASSVVATGTPGTIDMLFESQQHGGHDGAQNELSCDLSSDCWTLFDEALHVATASRLTPAAAPLGVGEESVVNLDGSEVLLSCGTNDPVSLSLFGQAGFSAAADEDASYGNPFYLGSLELSSEPPGGDGSTQAITLSCNDGSEETVTLGDVGVSLVQPAFGVIPRGEDIATFASSALQVWVNLELGANSFSLRRPNPVAWSFDTSQGQLDGAPTSMELTVPCGSASSATLRVFLNVESQGVTASPPTAALTVPSSVRCGDPVSLSGTFADPDGDLDEVRWEVDGVRLVSSVTQITVSESHLITAVATDARGAATSVSQAVSCN